VKEKGFDIIISSDTEYDNLCAEIYFDRCFVAIVSQENGIKNSTIEISFLPHSQKWRFSCLEFIEILQLAQAALEKMKKSD
jgi:hypothetical protein